MYGYEARNNCLLISLAARIRPLQTALQPLSNSNLSLEDAINRVKKITGKSNITTEDDMLHALDLYMEDHEEDDIFYSMHKFTVGDD